MAGRGRGYALYNGSKDATVPELRRPGAAALRQRISNISEPIPQETAAKPEQVTAVKLEDQVTSEKVETPIAAKNEEDKYEKLCDKIGQMSLSTMEKTLSSCAEDMKLLCDTPEKLERFSDSAFQFALKTKWNAHAMALFCNSHGDIAVNTIKFRSQILTQLQVLYNERNKSYLNLERFLSEVAFFCEIFHHLKILNSCLKALVSPLLDYLGMLVDGASFKEIELFVEQFPKCFRNVKENNPDGLNVLLIKIRKQIVSDTSTVTVKAMLLEMFEFILTDWKPLDHNAKFLYESLSKPIVRICN